MGTRLIRSLVILLDLLLGSGGGRRSAVDCPSATRRMADPYFRAFLGHCLRRVYGGNGTSPPPR
ncbi:MAG TPA: hypothetical protein VIN09_14555 [Chloroflexota bacterium]